MEDKDMVKLVAMMKGMLTEELAPISTRLQQLEEVTEELVKPEPEKKDSREGGSDGNSGEISKIVAKVSREKQLTKKFGSDTSGPALVEFLDHYTLCVEMNRTREVAGWDDPGYRAKELRFQLEGEAAVYVRQEETMLETWVNDDEEIIKKLKDRWLNRDCIELDIIEFEEVRQGDGESLAQYMQRVKGLGQKAFGEFDPAGMQQRIIWRFLDGVRDRDVRSEIIRARWMVDRKTPKPYDEILKIAEGAKHLKVAAGATGAYGSSQAKISVVQGHRNRKNSGPECFYFKERHHGGWRTCSRRIRENPTWSPSNRREKTPSNESNNSNSSYDRRSSMDSTSSKSSTTSTRSRESSGRNRRSAPF